VSWHVRNTLVQALSHQTPHHQPSRTCVVEAVPPVGVGTPWGSSVSLATSRGWLGPARGESPWPQIRRWDRRRAVPHAAQRASPLFPFV
jgi:hypothetical protein